MFAGEQGVEIFDLSSARNPNSIGCLVEFTAEAGGIVGSYRSFLHILQVNRVIQVSIRIAFVITNSKCFDMNYAHVRLAFDVSYAG